MVTLFLILGLMPVLVFIELTVHRWLFKNGAEQRNRGWNSTGSGMTNRDHIQVSQEGLVETFLRVYPNPHSWGSL